MTKSRGILPKRERWTNKQLALLREWYPHKPAEELQKIVGRDVPSIYAKANKLGLKKTPEYLAGPHACRLRRDDNPGLESRFKPGHEPWNKGKKGVVTGGEQTRFKKGFRGGRALERYQPIGSERVTKDGYLQRKVNDDLPLQRRWRAVHVIVWEEANGPLPHGHVVIFKDGNKRNLELDNLELVSRSELMRRNTIHNLPKEVVEVVQLRGALKRKINRLEKSNGKHD